MDKNPKISVAIPIHDMDNGDFFLSRLLNSLQKQTFRDFEIVITKKGKMAENTNAAMRACKGEFIKILYMDDYLAHEDALQEILDGFYPEATWLATGCLHDSGGSVGAPHLPSYSGIEFNQNTIGSPSVVTLRNENLVFFDENMSWLLDVDWYKKMGPPKLLNTMSTVIGIGDHQMTRILTDEEKQQEAFYLNQKND